jgi:hypothetical protein
MNDCYDDVHYLEEKVGVLEMELEEARRARDTAQEQASGQAEELRRLVAVEAEYARLKKRAAHMEDEIERLARRVNGEGDWICSDCAHPLKTVTEWEQHECMTPGRVLNALVGRYAMVDPELIAEAVWEQAEAEQILELLVKLRPIIERTFHEPEVSLELNYYGQATPSWSQLRGMVTFDIWINPTEHPAEAFQSMNRVKGLARDLPGFREQHKVDISVRYAARKVA